MNQINTLQMIEQLLPNSQGTLNIMYIVTRDRLCF